MAWLRMLLSRIGGLLAGSEKYSDAEVEMKAHLDLLTDRFVRNGMSPEAAKYAALRQFGGITRMKERQYETRTILNAEHLLRDLKYGIRAALRNPGFAAAVVVTLALGIGANVAIYSAVNAVLLKPLAFKNSQQIVLLWGITPSGGGWRGKQNFSAPDYFDLKERSRSFESMATFNRAMVVLTDGTPAQVKAGTAPTEFFRVLGVKPMLGRTFLTEEEQAGRDHIVILSHSLWQSRFQSDPNILGQTIRLNTNPYTVIGVLPEFEFSIPGYFDRTELWMPAIVPRAGLERTHHYLNVIARLKPGLTIQQAQQDVDLVTSRLVREHPKEIPGLRTVLVRLHDQIAGDARRILLVSFGAVGFLLLIACSNVANLQLSRSMTREKEIALRLALGATRGRIITQLLTESVVLALMGGALGVTVAWYAIRFLKRSDLFSIARQHTIAMDYSVLLYSVVLSIATGILFGLAAAWKSSSNNLAEPLKEGGRGSSTGDRGRNLRSALTIVEVALSVVLLIGAGLLTRSFIKLLQVDPGFDPKNVLTLQINLPRYRYPDPSKKVMFYNQVLREMRVLPGVLAVGTINDLPLTRDADADNFSIEGQTNGIDPTAPRSPGSSGNAGLFQSDAHAIDPRTFLRGFRFGYSGARRDRK